MVTDFWRQSNCSRDRRLGSSLEYGATTLGAKKDAVIRRKWAARRPTGHLRSALWRGPEARDRGARRSQFARPHELTVCPGNEDRFVSGHTTSLRFAEVALSRAPLPGDGWRAGRAPSCLILDASRDRMRVKLLCAVLSCKPIPIIIWRLAAASDALWLQAPRLPRACV